MTTEEQVAAILKGWTVTTCANNGAFWTIGGFDPYGRNHSGSRADPIALAHDLARLAEPPVSHTPPAPEPVQPTAQEQVSASPVEDPPIASAGDAASREEIQGEVGLEQVEYVEPPPAVVAPQSTPPAYAGTMLHEDEVGLRKTALKAQITDYATALIRARVPSDAGLTDRLQELRHLTMMSAQGVAVITEAQTAELNLLEKVPGWIVKVQEHSALLQQRVDDKQSLAELAAFDPFHGWPT